MEPPNTPRAPSRTTPLCDLELDRRRTRAGAKAEHQLEVIENSGAEIVALQEATPYFIELVRHSSAFDVSSFALSFPPPGYEHGVETFACAVFVRGGWEQHGEARTLPLTLPAQVGELPAWHRSLIVPIRRPGHELTIASFHVVPGAAGRNKWRAGAAKSMFFHALANWLSGVRGHAIVGLDANSPKWDRIDPQPSDFWFRRREGDQNEHLVLDPLRRTHALRDALRDAYLRNTPQETQPLGADAPLASLSPTPRYQRKQPGAVPLRPHLHYSGTRGRR